MDDINDISKANFAEENEYNNDSSDSFNDLEPSSGRWSKHEDDLLKQAVDTIGARNWKRISSDFLQDRRSDVQCLHRWQKVLRPGLVKGPWTSEEDNTIRVCMEEGITRWSEIAKRVPGRIGKQCRERWFNHLGPGINRTTWSAEEDELLIRGQRALGNRWSKIAKLYLPGRPENAVKNRWNAATRRQRLENNGLKISQRNNVAKEGSDKNDRNDDAKLLSNGTFTDLSLRNGKIKRRRFKRGVKRSSVYSDSSDGNVLSGHEGIVALSGLCAVLEPIKTPKKVSYRNKEQCEQQFIEIAQKKIDSYKPARKMQKTDKTTGTEKNGSNLEESIEVALEGGVHGKQPNGRSDVFRGTAALLAALDQVEGVNGKRRLSSQSNFASLHGLSEMDLASRNITNFSRSVRNGIRQSSQSDGLHSSSNYRALQPSNGGASTSSTGTIAKGEFAPASALLFLSRQEVRAAN